MGISVEVSGIEELRRYEELLERLADPSHKTELLESLGSAVVSQTQRRIQDEKESPAGVAWPAWSPSYAKTREGDKSLLQDQGEGRDSIQFIMQKDSVRIGSPLDYMRVHQDGFSGTVQVAAHTRMITSAFGKALKQPVQQSISSFSRQMEIPQREFLGLSSDNQNEIYQVLGDFWKELMK